MKRKIIILAILAACAVALFSGCVVGTARIATTYGVGEMTSRTFAVGHFDELEIDGNASFIVIFRQSDTINVIAEMQENLFDYHEISVRGGRLTATQTTDNRIAYGDNRPRLYIYAPSIAAITVNGSLRTENWDTIRVPNFSIVANGFVSFAADIEVETLRLSLNGASELDLSGHAHSADITKNGAGNINARHLQTADATIVINGIGDIEIAVSDTLDATLTGIGSIRYLGNPTITQSVSAAALGTIRQVE